MSTEAPTVDTLKAVLYAVESERQRQKTLLAEGHIRHDCANPDISDGERLQVLTEEVGEVARAMMEQTRYELYEELVQVAAVAVACAEGVLLQYQDEQ